MGRSGNNARNTIMVLIAILVYQLFLVFISYSPMNLILTFVNIGLIALVYFLTCD
jgi:uncharacterized membrane protein